MILRTTAVPSGSGIDVGAAPAQGEMAVWLCSQENMGRSFILFLQQASGLARQGHSSYELQVSTTSNAFS